MFSFTRISSFLHSHRLISFNWALFMYIGIVRFLVFTFLPFEIGLCQYFWPLTPMWSCLDHRGRCVGVCLWRTNEIGCVKGTGSWLWSLWRINVPGELSSSTGGAVDVLPTAAVPQLRSVESKGITPTIVLPITANYWSVTQLGEWLMAFQRDVEGFNYKQHTATNHYSPHLC